MEDIMDLKSKVRVIEGFPKEGISFKDITTLLKDKDAFKETVDILCEKVKDLEFDYIAGIEARGFIFAVPMAYKLNKGFIPVRKPGKLPGKVITKEYDLEYGKNQIEIDADVLKPGDKVLLIDDLLATGGTAKAALEIIEETGAKVVCAGFLIELEDLKGIELFGDYNTFTLIKYEH
ncbi:adenine phosphoribosyltransferase [Helcococcus bovis]|uniref:adenine phosphoribosyltransferase n=1 Tax=Helcococcus bovis TaxID=3153252 RepID=UPI0038B95D04